MIILYFHIWYYLMSHIIRRKSVRYIPIAVEKNNEISKAVNGKAGRIVIFRQSVLCQLRNLSQNCNDIACLVN